jgi:DnaJ-class molecular chaperone
MDHYKTLGVDKNSTPDEIKKAYRKLASKHHPDKGGDTAMFQKVEEAYRVLSDPQQRQQYDNPMPQGFGPGGFSFHSNGFDMNDLFSQIFSQQRQQPRQQVYRTVLAVDLGTAFTGGEQIIKLQTHTNTHHVKVNVPRGVENGMQLRLDNVIDGASLMVEFRVTPSLKFERSGPDLLCSHPISVLDLIAGGSFEFTTISGKTFEVTVKPKTQPYTQLKISGQGMPIYGSNNFGDQIILLKPFIPDKIDDTIISSILQSKEKGTTV